jgi:hypothetical protein
VIAGRALGTSRMSRNLRPWRPGPAAAAPCAAGAGPWAVGKPTQGSPGRAVASQTVSSHRMVTVVRGRRTPILRGVFTADVIGPRDCRMPFMHWQGAVFWMRGLRPFRLMPPGWPCVRPGGITACGQARRGRVRGYWDWRLFTATASIRTESTYTPLWSLWPSRARQSRLAAVAWPRPSATFWGHESMAYPFPSKIGPAWD